MRTLRVSIIGAILVAVSALGVAAQAQERPAGSDLLVVEGTGSFAAIPGHASGTNTMSDPRVSGDVVVDYDYVCDPTMSNCSVWGEETITNDGGSWVGEFIGLIRSGPTWENNITAWLNGSGDYEGWSYVVNYSGPMSASSAEGLISRVPLPPTVALGMTEASAVIPPAQAAEEPEVGEPVTDVSQVPPDETIGEPADDGAAIVAVEQQDERTVDLTIDSPAVGTRKARLLLPAGFDSEAGATWPVLYLLHGAMGNHSDWTTLTDAADLVADLGLLVVLPDGGADSWYSDWWNGGEGGPPMWETFHLTELRQLLERNWQAGEDRAVAGVSMGGLGAMSYAARNPELFKAAASFSGHLKPLGSEFHPDGRIWGDKVAQADIWEAHDPISLAPALEGMALYVSYGNGEVGPFDDADALPDQLEAWLAEMNEAFVTRLDELGIPVTVDAYGPGRHDWPYFEQGLHGAMPLLLKALDG